jgi:hypothetical protein
MSGIYGVLDQAIAFEKKLQKDEHDRLMSKKEDVVLVAVYSSESFASFVRCLITLVSS